MIKVSVKPVTDPAFIERLRGQSKAFAQRQAVVLGESMVREVVEIVTSEFNPGDPDHRKPGPHLAESFTYEVEPTATGANVRLTIKRGVSAKKVAALEFGVDHDYEITPSGITFGQGGLSVNKKRAAQLTNLGLTGRPTKLLRWPDPGGGKDKYAPVVTHKAFEGKHFMSRAVEIAVAKMRARSRR